MKKRIAFYILLLSVIAIASFGVGGGIAKLRIKYFDPVKKTIVIRDSISLPNQAVEENKEEEKITEDAEINDAEEKTENLPETIIPSVSEFSFAILGDTQYFKPGSGGGYQTAVANIKKNNPNLVFAVGDLVSSCDKKEECEGKLSAWKNALGTLSGKTYATQGNHDRTGKDKADSAWEKAFSNFPSNGPQGYKKFTYSLDFENSHFVVLDSDKPKENDINKTQLDWLEGDLTRNKKENIFVFFHEPAYPTNSKIGESLDVNSGNRDRLWNILARYKVKAIFSGHEHIQSRRKVGGLYQFGFGNTDSFNHLAPKPGMAEYSHIGQAFGIVKVAGKEITVNVYSVNGVSLNSFKIPN